MLRNSIQTFRATVVAQPCAISRTTMRGVGSFATRHGNDPEVLEKGKQENLRKHDPSNNEQPSWNETIASDSEAFVKATRSELEHGDKSISELQQHTTKHLKEQRKAGKDWFEMIKKQW